MADRLHDARSSTEYRDSQVTSSFAGEIFRGCDDDGMIEIVSVIKIQFIGIP